MIQLRVTTSRPHSMFEHIEDAIIDPTPVGELIQSPIKGRCAYLHAEIEDLAGFDIPIFIDGDMGQLDLPNDQQDILVMLPDGNHRCIATLQINKVLDYNVYYITLKV